MLQIRLSLLASIVILGTAFGVSHSLFQGEEVRSLLYNNSQLWASATTGLYSIEAQNKTQISLSIENDIITTMVNGDNNVVYAGTYDGKLITIDSDKKSTIKQLPQVGDYETYYLVDLDFANNEVWIGTLEGVVFRYNVETGVFDHYDLKTFNRKSFLNILQIAVDDDENVWVCSQDRIYFLTTLFSPKKEKIYEFLGSSTYDQMQAQYVEKGDDGIYVLGTADGINSLSLGYLNRAYVDASKSKIELPAEIVNGKIRAFNRVSDQELWLLHDKLYKYDGTNWTSFEVDGLGKEVHDLEVSGSTIWIASSNGLKTMQLK